MMQFNEVFRSLMRALAARDAAGFHLDAPALHILDDEGMVGVAVGAGIGVEAPLAAAFRERIAKLRARDGLHAAVLERVNTAVEQAGLTALVFKGEALARTHYAASFERQRTDIDLWLRPDDLRPAVAALRLAGCRLVSGLVSRYARFEVVFDAGLPMPVGLDLHIRPFFRPWRLQSLTFDRVLESAAALPGLSCLCAPDPVTALILAAVHLDKNPHKRAIWLYDIHLLGRDPLIRERAIALAGIDGETNTVQDALTASDALFGDEPWPLTSSRPQVHGRGSALARDLRALPTIAARLRFLRELAGFGVEHWPVDPGSRSSR